MASMPRHSLLWVVAGLVFAGSAAAQEPISANVDGMVNSAAYLASAEALEAELAAIRQRLSSLETDPSGNSAAYWNPAPVSSGWKADVEYLHWTLRRGDLDYAISTDAGAVAVGTGVVQNLAFDGDSGLRARLAYLTGTGWEISFGYTYFHTAEAAMAQEPAGGNLWATRSHPDSNEEALTARALGSFNYNVFDFEAAHAFEINRFATVTLLGGLRWANIEQDLRIEYDGRDFTNAVVSQPLSMNAFGVPLGLQGEWHLAGGWTLFGRGVGSVLYGSFRSHLLETNLAGTDTIVDVRDNYDNAVFAAEATVGLSWENDWLEFAGGYQLNSWSNLGNRSAFHDDQHEGLYTPAATDLLLDGFFFRCTVLF